MLSAECTNIGVVRVRLREPSSIFLGSIAGLSGSGDDVSPAIAGVASGGAGILFGTVRFPDFELARCSSV